MTISRTSAIVAAATLLAGCGGDSSVPAAFRGAAADCISRSGGSRWASSNGEYRQSVEFGRSSSGWLYQVAGIAASDSLVAVYDAPQSRITLLNDRLVPVQSFGRKGSGPGDLSPALDMIQGGDRRWLDLSGDTVAVFDGTRFHLFTRAGRLVGEPQAQLVGSPELSNGAAVVAFRSGVLLAPKGGYDLALLQPASERYRWELRMHTGRHSRRVLSLQLEPLPTTAGGVPFTGPEQAQPLWDMRGGCVVASDGTGRWLIRTTLATARPDTVRLTLPAVKAPPVDHEEIARLMGMASKGQSGGYVGPTALKRLSALVIDPDGYAWLLPWQDSTNVLGGGVEVVRISLATGAMERDTVPAFPAAFGAPGVYYARSYDRHTEEAVVRRYDLSPAAGGGGR